MADTNLTVISNRTGDAEGLKAKTDFLSSLSSTCYLILNSNSAAYNISPSSIFKADRLNALNDIVSINACFIADFLCLFNGGNAVLIKLCIYLIYSSFIAFK